MNRQTINYQSVVAIYKNRDRYFINQQLIRSLTSGELDLEGFFADILRSAALDLEQCLSSKEHLLNFHLDQDIFKDMRLDVMRKGDMTIFELVSITDAINRLIDINQMQSVLFMEANVPVMLIDPKNGDIIAASRAARNFYGYPVQGVVYENINNINMIPRAQIEREMHSALSKRKDYYNFQHRLASGEIKAVEVHANPIEISGRHYMMAFVLDLSHREQGQRILFEELKKYELVFNAMSESVYIAQLDDRYRSSRFEDVNAAAVKQLGYSREEMLEMSPRDIDVSLTKTQYREICKYLEQDGRHTFHTDHRRKDGTVVHNMITSSVFEYFNKKYLVSIVRDVTDLTKVQREKLMESDRLIKLFEHIDEAAFILDGQGRVRSQNPRAEEMFGYGIEEIFGKPMAELFGNDTQREEFKRNFDIISEGRFESFRGYRTDRFGISHLIQAKAFAYFNALGEREYILLYQDLSEEESLDQRVRSYEEVFSQTTQCVFITDDRHRVIWTNDAMLHLMDMEASALLGMTPEELFTGKTEGNFAVNVLGSLETYGRFDGRIRMADGKGQLRVFDAKVIPIGTSERQTRFACLMTDVTEEARMDSAYKDLKSRHSVTNLYTRRHMKEIGPQLLVHWKEDCCAALLVIEEIQVLINLMGHSFVDELSKTVSNRLTELSGDEVLFSYGRDTFAVVGGSRGVESVVDAMLSEMEAPIRINGFPISLTLSVGRSRMHPGDVSAQDLLNRAVVSVNQMQRGENCSFEREVHILKIQSPERLVEALRENDLRPVFLPVRDALKGTVIGYEARLEWSADKTWMKIDELFAASQEQSAWDDGKMCAVMMEEIMGRFARQQEPENKILHVDIPATHWLDDHFINRVELECRQWRIPVEQLRLGINANVYIQSPTLFQEGLEKASSKGMAPYLSNYSGQSMNPRYLISGGISEVRWNPDCLASMAGDPRFTNVVGRMNAVLNELGLTCTALGVRAFSEEWLVRNGFAHVQRDA